MRILKIENRTLEERIPFLNSDPMNLMLPIFSALVFIILVSRASMSYAYNERDTTLLSAAIPLVVKTTCLWAFEVASGGAQRWFGNEKEGVGLEVKPKQ